MILEILPLKGVGPIKLGMTSKEAQAAVKVFCGDKYEHSKSREIDYFFGSAIEVSYDDEGRAEFIGAQYYTDCGCDFEIYGVDPFDLEAQKLFEHIASQQPEPHTFNPDDYLFRGNIITLWNSDEQYDRKGGEERPIYAQVGIGNALYLAAVDRIRCA